MAWSRGGWGQDTAEHVGLVRGRAPASKVGCGALWLCSCGGLLLYPLEGLPPPVEVELKLDCPAKRSHFPGNGRFD